jgi:anti-anti-sigma factor
VSHHTQSTPELFETECADEAGRRVLALRGELDLQAVPHFEAVTSQALADDPVMLILDLSGLTFIDSSGMRSVLAAREHADGAGQGFGMIPGPANVQKLFAIAGILDGLPWLSERDTPGPEPSPAA